MATTITTSQVTLTVPAAYVEDFRAALVREIETATGLLGDSDPLEMGVEILSRDVRLLDQLPGRGVGEVELTAEHDKTSNPVLHALEALVHVLTERLEKAAGYGPLPMGDVLELTERLRWAAQEAIRIEPAVADRVVTAHTLELVA